MRKLIVAATLVAAGIAMPAVAAADGSGAAGENGKALGVRAQACVDYYHDAFGLPFETLGESHQWILAQYGTEFVGVPAGMVQFCAAFLP